MRTRTLLTTAVSAALLMTGAVSATASSAIERIDGADRYETAVYMTQEAFKRPGVDTLYLASGEGFADAIAAAPVAGRSDSPLLLTRYGSLPQQVREELERLNPKRVVIAGGEAAVAPAVADAVRAALPGADLERAAGRDRYETAARLSAAASERGEVDRVYLVTGRDFPDALAAAPAAAAPRSALLTMPGHQMTPEGLAELARLAPREIVTVGAVATRKAELIAQIEQYAAQLREQADSIRDEAEQRALDNFLAQLSDDDRQRYERIAGQDRYETSAMMSWHTAPQPGVPSTYIASGRDYPDALVSAAAAARTGSPVLLVNESGVPALVHSELERLRPQQVIVAGGPAAVPDSVAAAVVRAATPPAPAPTRPSPKPTEPANDNEQVEELVAAFDEYQEALITTQENPDHWSQALVELGKMTAVAASIDEEDFTGVHATFAGAYEQWAGELGTDSFSGSAEAQWVRAHEELMLLPTTDPETHWEALSAYIDALEVRAAAITPMLAARSQLVDEVEFGFQIGWAVDSDRTTLAAAAGNYVEAAFEAHGKPYPEDGRWEHLFVPRRDRSVDLVRERLNQTVGRTGNYVDFLGPTASGWGTVLADASVKVSAAHANRLSEGGPVMESNQVVEAHEEVVDAVKRVGTLIDGVPTPQPPPGWDWDAFFNEMPADLA